MRHDLAAQGRMVGALLLSMLVAASACTVAIPPPGSAAEQRVIAQGAEYDKAITAQYGVYEDEQLAAYVDRVGQAVAAESLVDKRKKRLFVIIQQRKTPIDRTAQSAHSGWKVSRTTDQGVQPAFQSLAEHLR